MGNVVDAPGDIGRSNAGIEQARPPAQDRRRRVEVLGYHQERTSRSAEAESTGCLLGAFTGKGSQSRIALNDIATSGRTGNLIEVVEAINLSEIGGDPAKRTLALVRSCIPAIRLSLSREAHARFCTPPLMLYHD